MSPRERERDPEREPKSNPSPEPDPWPDPKHTRVRSLYEASGAEAENVVTLGPRDSLHGRLDVDGDLRIEGSVEGELKASGNISIEPSASIRGGVEGSNLSVRGQLDGKVTVRRRLIIGATGHVSGEVTAGRLTIEDGAILNGNVRMVGEGTTRREH